MAPSPEHDNEPKAPDKTDNKRAESLDGKPTLNETHEDVTTSRDLDVQEASVSHLTDEELRGLLDEAINYKTPKDREGKSKMFNVLLQEAEEDERNARAASASGPQLARYYNTSASRRRRDARRDAGVAARLTHGGSLQDLAQPALYVDMTGPASRRRRRGGNNLSAVAPCPASVSARQREGGSLPSNVNVGVSLFDRGPIFDDVVRRRRDKTSKNTTTTMSTSSAASTAAGAVSNTPNTSLNTTSATSTPSVEQTKRVERQFNVSATTTSPTTSVVAAPKDKKAPPAIELECIVSGSDVASVITGTDLEAAGNDPSEEETIRCMETACSVDIPSHDTMSTSLILTTDEDDIIVPPRIPRVSYTSHAKLEVEDKFPQLQHPQAAPTTTVELNDDWNSVSCIVKGPARGTSSDLTPSDTPAMAGSTARHTGPAAAAATAAVTTMMTSHYRLSVPSKLLHSVDRIHHATITSTSDKKGLDENGNAVQSSGISHDSKKKKKCKVDRNVTVLNSEEVEGHRADIITCIDLLVKYIEEDGAVKSGGGSGGSGGGTRNHHAHQTAHNHMHRPVTGKHKHQVDGKRRTRTKPKAEVSVKKSNSLEEISRSKLEDLLVPSDNTRSASRSGRARVRKQSTSDDGERRSWGAAPPVEESGSAPGDTRRATPTCEAATPDLTPAPGEFHVVTKKKKSRKRRSSSGGAHRHQRTAPATDTVPDDDDFPEVTPPTPVAPPCRRYQSNSDDQQDCDILSPVSNNNTSPTTMTNNFKYNTTIFNNNNNINNNNNVNSTSSIKLIQNEQKSPPANETPVKQVTTSSAQLVEQQDGVRNRGHSRQPSSAGEESIGGDSGSSPPCLQTLYTSSKRTFNCHEGKTRRKSTCSVPPSERGSDSSDGDSVHSLPAEQAVVVLGASSTTSYADIARTAGPVTGLPPPAPPTTRPTQSQDVCVDEFPTLRRTGCGSSNSQSGGSGWRRSGGTGAWSRRGGSFRNSAPDRPAVIILDDAVCASVIDGSEPIQVSGLTFGFELNEQLLNNSGETMITTTIATTTTTTTSSSSSLSSSTNNNNNNTVVGVVTPLVPTLPASTSLVVAPHKRVMSGHHLDHFCARYMPPPVDHGAYNYDKIVEYIGLAWEDVIQQDAKVQYYNGQ